MDFKKIRKGMYFRWIAERYMRSWDVYGKITKKGKDYIEVITFDDFKTVRLTDRGDDSEGAIRHEMTIVSKEDVLDYIETAKDILETRKMNLKMNYKKSKRKIEREIDKFKNMEI